MNFSQLLAMPTSAASEKYTKILNVQVSDTRGDAMKNYSGLKKEFACIERIFVCLSFAHPHICISAHSFIRLSLLPNNCKHEHRIQPQRRLDETTVQRG